MVFGNARYCNGFPNIGCNTKRLAYSIISIPSRGFPSLPAGFVTKFTTVVARVHVDGVGSWLGVPGRKRVDLVLSVEQLVTGYLE